MIEPPAPPQPSSPRALKCLLACFVFAGVGMVLVAASAWLLRYEIRVALTEFDTRWTLEGALGPADVQDAQGTLKRRLKAAGLPASIHSGERGTLVVELRAEDAERLRFVLLSRGGIRLMIGVDPSDAAAREAAQEEEARADEGGANVRRYAFLPWTATADQHEDEPFLVRRADAIRPQDFAGFEVSLSSLGEPALGFQMTREGSDRLHALTLANVDKQLAMVIGEEVYSAPLIRGPIRERGIVEGGLGGWSEERIADLIAVLEGGELPQPLVVAAEEPLPR